MPKSLSLTIRWWHWALLALVLFLSALIATGFALRSSSRAHYQKTVDDLKAQGKIASVDDLITAAPVVDVGLQDDWDAWQQTFVGSGTASGVELSTALSKHQTAWDLWLLGRGLKPQEVEEIIVANTAHYAAAIRMLSQGRLVLSGLGWIAKDLPAGKRRMPFAAMVRLPQLLAVRDLAVWLRYSTVLADDPRQYLSNLDSLLASMQRPVTLIDAMIAVSVARIRDRAYGDLALLGRLPDEVQQRWLSEPSPFVHLVGDAFAGESILMIMTTAGMLDETPLAEFLPALSSWGRFRDGVGVWTHGHADCAIIVDLETRVSQRLHGERSDWPDWRSEVDRLGPIGRIVLPNLSESAITALHADAHHRMARLAVRVIALGRMGQFPTDEPALVAALAGSDDLTPTGDHLHLRYEVPAPGRFRLSIDPASPIPNFDDPVRAPIRSKPVGTPPAAAPLVWQIGPQRSSNQGQYIEILLPPASGSH